MKVEVTSKSGIRFSVELTEEEKGNIKKDLEDNAMEIVAATTYGETDTFLREVKNIL